MSDTVTKAELAEVCRMIAAEKDGRSIFTGDWIKLADRLDPPKVEAKWPEQLLPGEQFPRHAARLEVYPAGVVGPVVEGLRYLTHGHICRRVEGQCAPCAALAAFDAACKGKP